MTRNKEIFHSRLLNIFFHIDKSNKEVIRIELIKNLFFIFKYTGAEDDNLIVMVMGNMVGNRPHRNIGIVDIVQVAGKADGTAKFTGGGGYSR